MLQKKLRESPDKVVAFGLTLVVIGLMMVVIGANWQRIPYLAHLWPAWNDFLHGFIIGIAITLEIAGVVINAIAAANRRKRSSTDSRTQS